MALGGNAFYANTVSVSYIPVDVVIRFGFMSPAEQEGSRQEVLCIHMSPLMAKAVARALSDMMAKYEAQFGPLPEIAPGVERSSELQ